MRYKNYTNSKKSIGFFSLIGPITFILTLMWIFSFVSVNNSENYNYDNHLIDIDLYMSQIPIQRVYLENLFELKINELKLNLLEKIKETNSENLLFENTNIAEYKGCQGMDDLPLWYNQKNLEFYQDKLKNLEDSENQDINSKENNIINDKENLDKYLCKFDFSSNLEQIIIDELNDILSKNSIFLKNRLNINEIKVNVELKNDELKNENYYQIKLNSIYFKDEENFKIKSDLEFSKNLSLEIYQQLFVTLNDELENFLLNYLTDKLPNCISNSVELENKDLSIKDFCYEKLFKDYLNEITIENKINLNDYYNFRLTSILDTNQGDTKKIYNGIKFEVYNNQTNKLELKFGVLVEDLIPFDILNFNVKNSQILDNVLIIEILRPEFYKDVENYVVLYSNKNFLNNEKLFEVIKNKEISNYFIQDSNGFMHSEEFDITLYNNDVKIKFEENSNPTNIDNIYYEKNNNFYKNIDIFQIFDLESSSYRRLNSNEEIYLYVFAIDSNSNYNLEGIEGKTLNVMPQIKLGPKPLIYDKLNPKSNQIYITSNIENFNNAIKFETNNYDDIKFSHYDIYILKDLDVNNLEYNCNNFKPDDFCYRIDGKNYDFLKNKTTKFIITSDSGYQNLNNENIIFFNSANLETQNFYDVALIPVDIYGNSITSLITIPKEVIKTQNQFEIISTPNQVSYKPYFFNVKINSNIQTSQNTDNFYLSSMKYNGENLLVNWNKVDVTDLSFDKLIGNLEYLDSNGVLKSKYEVLILEDSRVVLKNSLTKVMDPKDNKVVLSNIFAFNEYKPNLVDYGTNDKVLKLS